MIRYAKHTLARLPYELLLAAVLMLVIWQADPGNPNFGLVAALMFTLGFTIGIIRTWVMDHDAVALMARDRIEELTAVIGEYMKSQLAVDIWQFQEDLMKASDQRRPDTPTMHAGVVLYGALMAEETAETFRPIVMVLERMATSIENIESEDPEAMAAVMAMRAMAKDFDSMAAHMTSASLSIRGRISYMGSEDAPLTVSEAIELLDGVTDVAVVTAGAGIAAGLPARAAYEEVGSSNLSKANPVTGKIEKDAGGKWIKGVNFRKPDLWSVLSAQQDKLERRDRRANPLQ